MQSQLKATWRGAVYARHQVEGIEWMLKQEKDGFLVKGTAHGDYTVRGGMLGDEMGLGKTIQSLALIVNGKGVNTLIISPLAVKKQWIEAASRSRINIFTAEKSGWVRVGKRIVLAKSIYIGHYEKVVSTTSLFKQVDFDRIILDEAHRIRNTKTATGRSVLKINATYKWALTATPIVNKMDDVVAYLKFIGFKIESNSWSDKYSGWIPNIYLARTMEEGEAPAGLTMPPTPVTEVKYLDFTNKEEETVYNGILNNIESQWRSAQAMKGIAYQLQRFAILLRLRQVSVNPQIYINARKKEPFGWTGPEINVPSRKFDEISHLLRESYNDKQTNRWIIFCQFHEEINLLSAFLKAFPFIGSILQYHGGLSSSERDAAIEASKIPSGEGKQDVFLIQLQAGGTGLNLQNYNRIIFISPWWTSALLEQARGRAVRIGQKDVVKIYWLKLIAEEGRISIDDLMMSKATEKKELATMFLNLSHNRITQI
uniref:Helicase n=1 Tax=viral metagenome TaxID=1070528 RepID=A0A6C0AMC5_9ZZZZ